jgi:hypothetical protein
MDTRPADSSPESSMSESRPRLPWWIAPLGIGIAMLLAAIVWIVAIAAPIPVLPADSNQLLFTVYPPPSFTPVPPTAAPTPYVTPTLALPTVMPGAVGVGIRVEVAGTSGDGLRLRDAPSTSGKILYLAGDHEIFDVVDGPKTGNGYTWWQLQGVYDTTRQGWAVENYLKPSNP